MACCVHTILVKFPFLSSSTPPLPPLENREILPLAHAFLPNHIPSQDNFILALGSRISLSLSFRPTVSSLRERKSLCLCLLRAIFHPGEIHGAREIQRETLLHLSRVGANGHFILDFVLAACQPKITLHRQLWVGRRSNRMCVSVSCPPFPPRVGPFE